MRLLKFVESLYATGPPPGTMETPLSMASMASTNIRYSRRYTVFRVSASVIPVGKKPTYVLQGALVRLDRHYYTRVVFGLRTTLTDQKRRYVVAYIRSRTSNVVSRSDDRHTREEKHRHVHEETCGNRCAHNNTQVCTYICTLCRSSLDASSVSRK